MRTMTCIISKADVEVIANETPTGMDRMSSAACMSSASMDGEK